MVHRVRRRRARGLPPAGRPGRARHRSSRWSRWSSATRPPSSARSCTWRRSGTRGSATSPSTTSGPGRGRSPTRWRRPRPRRRSRRRWRRSAATTPACAPTATSWAGGPSANLVSLYFGDGHQMLDFRTFQDHRAPDTTSDLLFKGAVDDDSHSVYTGPHPGAAHRPGHQRLPDQPQHQAVRAGLGRIGARPRDREQRRALLPRLDGRPHRRSTSASTSRAAACRPTVAERLILSGFFDEVIDRLAGARRWAPTCARRIAAKLGDRRRSTVSAGAVTAA